MSTSDWIALGCLGLIPIVLFWTQIKLNASERAAHERKLERDKKEEEFRQQITELRKFIERVSHEYYNLRMEIYQEYAKSTMLAATESRFVKAVERIDLKLDRMAEEINKRELK